MEENNRFKLHMEIYQIGEKGPPGKSDVSYFHQDASEGRAMHLQGRQTCQKFEPAL